MMFGESGWNSILMIILYLYGTVSVRISASTDFVQYVKFKRKVSYCYHV